MRGERQLTPVARPGAPTERARRLFVSLAGIGALAGFQFAGDYPTGANLWYAVSFGSVQGQHAVTLAVLGLLLPRLLQAHNGLSGGVERRLSAAGLRGWAVLIAGVVAFAFARALVTDAENLFADWMNLAFFAVLTWAFATWLIAAPWRDHVLLDLALATGAFSGVMLVLFALGGGSSILGTRVPIFSGAHLQIAVFGSMLAFAAWVQGSRDSARWYGWAVKGALLTNSALVLLSFRRSHWLLFAGGMALVFFANRERLGKQRNQLAAMAITCAVLVSVVVSVLGSDRISERIESFSPSAETALATTNQDHIDDVLDALDVIAEEPLLGYGIGRFYETQRIRLWKTQSFDVHNAVVHAWLKYGLLGMIAYVGFHLQWIRATRPSRAPAGVRRATLQAVAAFILVELVVSLVGTWPYASYHLTVHRALMLAFVLAGTLPVQDAPRALGRGAASPGRERR